MATLYARISEGDGKFSWKTVEFTKKGQPIEPTGHVTSYSLRIRIGEKSKMTPAGKTLEEARVALQNFNPIEKSDGLALIEDFQKHQTSTPTRITIADAATEYKTEIRTLGRSKATIRKYTKAVEDFVGACQKVYMNEVDRKDYLAHIDWLRANLRKNGIGSQNVTIQSRLQDISTFLNRFGFKKPLATKQWPKAPKKNPDKYSTETINQMLAVANEDEKDLILFLLYTGFRDEEAAYCKYSDINWHKKTINVHDKPEYGWTVKDHEQRPIDILLPVDFVERIKTRRERNSGCELIFPNGKCSPDMHLIRRVRRVADKAQIEGRITLHKFRRTFGTLYARKFGTVTAQQVLGHSDIATTARYLAAEEMDTVTAKSAVEEMYSDINA